MTHLTISIGMCKIKKKFLNLKKNLKIKFFFIYLTKLPQIFILYVILPNVFTLRISAESDENFLKFNFGA